MADGSLIFDTKIDPSGARTGLASLDRLLKVGIGAIVAKQVADLGKIGLAYNSQMEDAEAAFSVLLGSTSKAKKHIKDLQEIALGTSFNTPQLANASKSFLAVGLSAEESKKQIEILGDISLGNTETFDYMALAMSQVAAKGRLMRQEAMQLRNTGLNPLELIAAQTGETMEELEARMSAGEISYEELTSAMEAATQEGGRFHNGLQVMKETFSGQVANITGSAKKLLGALTEPLFNWLSDIVLPKISAGLAFLNRNADATRAVVAMLGTAITVAFAIAKFNAIKGAIVSIGSAIKLFIVANPFLLVASAIAAVVVGLTMFIRSGGNVEDLMKKISKAIANFAKKLPGIFDSIAKELPGVIKSIAATVSKNLPEILKSGVTILTTILDGILQAIPKIIPVVIQVVTSFVSMLVANLPAIISAGIEILLALINGLLKALPKLIAMLPKIISTIY